MHFISALPERSNHLWRDNQAHHIKPANAPNNARHTQIVKGKFRKHNAGFKHRGRFNFAIGRVDPSICGSFARVCVSETAWPEN